MIEKIQKEMEQIIAQAHAEIQFKQGQVLVVGCSTSEVAGSTIGTAGTMEVAQAIFTPLMECAQKFGIELAFQCCEHLNRALVVERKTLEAKKLEEVTVVPSPHAGGSMATYAYKHLKDPVVVEYIKADMGIDIGDTLIGMHLKHVAVPIRIEQSQLGDAHITVATTRPKLIGGSRAIYQ